MTISSEDIRHIANLARLQVGAEEADSLGKDMNAILVHFERLKNLDLSGIDPFANAARSDACLPSRSMALWRRARGPGSTLHQEA